MNQINPHSIIRFFQNNGIAILVILVFVFLICRFPYQFEKTKSENKLIEAVEAQSQKRITKADSLTSVAETEIKKSAQIQKQGQTSKKIENEALQQIPTTRDSLFTRVREFSSMSNEDIRKYFDSARTPEHKQTAN